MNFEFSDEQRQLHDSVERYLAEQYSFEKFRAINATPAGWDKAAWRGLAELGVLALNVPAAQGGLGFGPLETLAMMGRLRPKFAARTILEQRRDCALRCCAHSPMMPRPQSC